MCLVYFIKTLKRKLKTKHTLMFAQWQCTTNQFESCTCSPSVNFENYVNDS